MTFSFNDDIAKKYGIHEAIFIHNIYFWINQNKHYRKNFFEGREWTYNSMGAFVELFPFFSKYQIRGIINKLKNNGGLLVGNFNKIKQDRTKWYALSDEIMKIYEDAEVQKDTSKCAKTHFQAYKNTLPSVQKDTPLPDSKPDIKPDSKPDSKQKGATAPKTKNIDFSEFSEKMANALTEWIDYKQERRESYTPIGLSKLLKITKTKKNEFGENAVCHLIDQSIANQWRGIIWDRLEQKMQKNKPNPYPDDGLGWGEGLKA